MYAEEEELKHLNEEVVRSYRAVNFSYDHSQLAEQEVQTAHDNTEYDSEGDESFKFQMH